MANYDRLVQYGVIPKTNTLTQPDINLINALQKAEVDAMISIYKYRKVDSDFLTRNVCIRKPNCLL